MKKKRFDRKNLRKGIYILPNIFTSLNIFCGFHAIISSINGNYTVAATSLIIAVIFDILDGKIARATNTTSKFGIEYDSLADLISFGVAPGLMMYLWALKPMGRIGWLAAFLLMVCGALRLARFNTHIGDNKIDYFIGLPIPAGAGMIASTVLFCHKFDIAINNVSQIIMLIMLYVISFLMVSSVKYKSFKKAEVFKKMNFNVLVSIILLLIFIAAQPSIALFSLGIVYIISGPLTTLWLLKTAKYDKKVEAYKTD